MKIILIRETLWQSLLADTYTFACLAFCIWFSWGSRFWMAVMFGMFLIFLLAKGIMAERSKVFRDEYELLAWLLKNSQDRARTDKWLEDNKIAIGDLEPDE